ncbi:single-stranded DNA-binding protein [Aromatoleum evansii]|uniref:single-stranded DNA-binding protein n=1 Tax=Aromatoleum evansii TaxID=59406 RepID=UPI00145D2F0A|nr:single-stranded DNA-binding protein [Aromatoleum evansii]NMG32346.1 single-stranded DNA-binding protein [Aromatoleum evansii]
MSAVQPIPSQSPQTTIKPGQVLVVGRCVSAKRQGQLYVHLIVMPAPDPYSSPATVEVLAKTRQADSEQDVRLLCRLGGYRRSYKSVDRETGEVRNVQTADNKLFLLED